MIAKLPRVCTHIDFQMISEKNLKLRLRAHPGYPAPWPDYMGSKRRPLLYFLPPSIPNLTGGSLNIKKLSVSSVSAIVATRFYYYALASPSVSRSRIQRRSRSTNWCHAFEIQHQSGSATKPAFQRHTILQRFQFSRQTSTIPSFHCWRPGLQRDSSRPSHFRRRVAQTQYIRNGTDS